eukprot:TRINITY_DN4903_c0_g1_i1.p1 TRINITY_DN4903_c0_g1~~TRINITY_DN4903_c0_g1_i1.p1  ORF type:complete len:382 (-),score=82.85 TRINITY_DN4903_c0_g1_i1:98-1219(-)
MSTPLKPPDPFFVFRGHTGEVQALKFHPSLPLLFTGAVDGELRVWDLKSRRCVSSVSAHKNSDPNNGIKSEGILHMTTLRNGQLLTQGRDGFLRVWDVENISSSSALAASPQHELETYSYSFGRCGVWESASTTLVSVPAPDDASTVFVWDLRESKPVMKIGPQRDPNSGSSGNEGESGSSVGLVMCTSMWSDAQTDLPTLCGGYEDGGVHLFDIRTNACLASSKLHTDPILNMHVLSSSPSSSPASVGDESSHSDPSSSGVQGVTCSADNHLVRWSIDTSRATISTTHTYEMPHPGANDIRIRGDGLIMASAGWDHRVRIWGWKKPKPLAVLRFHTTQVSAVDFGRYADTHGGKWIMASGGKDRRVALWEIY